MQYPEFTIDIEIIHIESHQRIELRYPLATKRLWKRVAAKTRVYAEIAEVKEILREFPLVAGEWVKAQVVLDRLSFGRPPHYLSFDEAHHCTDLIIATLLHAQRVGKRWEGILVLLVTMADITRYLFNPLPINGKNANAKDPAIECYEDLRKMIGEAPTWFSLREVYVIWDVFKDYQCQNKEILDLKKRLNALTKPFRFVLEEVPSV